MPASIVFIDDDGATFRSLFVDVDTEQRHALGAEITQFPVEGSQRNDHHQKKAVPFTITIINANTPGDRNGTRPRDTLVLLEEAIERHLPALIVTEWKTYGDDEDWMLVEAVADRTPKDGASWIRATLTFAPLIPFNTELVDDPTPARPRDRRQTDQGAQGTTAATPQMESLTADMIDQLPPGGLRDGLQAFLGGGNGS